MTADLPSRLRGLVAAALGALPLVEVLDQVDGAAPCQEPPDGTWQWTVSRRGYLAPGADVADVVRRLRSAHAGWSPVREDDRPGEARVQLRREDIRLTFAVAGGPVPQVVVTAVAPCDAGAA